MGSGCHFSGLLNQDEYAEEQSLVRKLLESEIHKIALICDALLMNGTVCQQLSTAIDQKFASILGNFEVVSEGRGGGTINRPYSNLAIISIYDQRQDG